MLSERSKIPPRPGIILPESFCPARRLKALSMRSEAIETTERGIRTVSAFQKLSSVGSNGLKMSNKSNPTRAAKTIPPIAPSTVFLGLMIESLCLPKSLPKI